MRPILTIVVGSLLLSSAARLSAQSLKGSHVSMQRQNEVAQEEDYTFLRDEAQVRKFVRLGLLVSVPGNADYTLDKVSFPYARPALKTFVARLAQQYHQACGEQLVLTSLTRPLSEQPSNASDLSVHPAGMAVDLRVSRKAACQSWLRRVLLSLENAGVLEATREVRPPHFHVAIFPAKYTAYVARLTRSQAIRLASADRAAATGGRGTDASAPDEDSPAQYQVTRGDSLWEIARRHNTTVAELKELNNLSSSRINAGQVITLPPGERAP